MMEEATKNSLIKYIDLADTTIDSLIKLIHVSDGDAFSAYNVETLIRMGIDGLVRVHNLIVDQINESHLDENEMDYIYDMVIKLEFIISMGITYLEE